MLALAPSLQPAESPVSGRSAAPLDIAILARLAPRKFGSMEQWLIGMAEEGARRGHRITVLGFEPIHPDVLAALTRTGAHWGSLEEVTQGSVAAAARRLRAFDVLHLNLLAPRERIALCAYAAWPARVLFVDHISGEAGEGALPWRSRLLDRATAMRLAAVAGVSEYVASRARRRFGRAGVPVSAIYNGIDLSRFTRPATRAANDVPVIAALANLIPEKGIDLVLRAVAKLDTPHSVVVIGDGPEAPALKRLAAELGIADRVDFLGLRNDAEVILGRADVFVHAARWAEAFGLGVAEAMASGCAVVATRIGALPELLDGGAGILVEPEDVDGLAATLARLSADPALRLALGRTARERALARFGISRCVAEHLDWCERYARAPRS